MKIALSLSPCESETLFQLSINHPWRDARLRAAALLMLSKGEHPSAITQQCGISHQSIYNWRHAWERQGVVGLIGGHAGGRPRKLSEAWLASVCELARTEALTLRGLAQRAEAIHGQPFPLSLDRLGAILRKSGFSFKRTRMSLKKKRDAERFAACAAGLAEMKAWAREGGCQLFYYDEAGFSASPPVQRAWSPVGSPHAVTPAHHQRVTVMGALDFTGQRLYHTQASTTVNRESFVAFMDDLIPKIAQPVPTFIILDNTRIHHGWTTRSPCAG